MVLGCFFVADLQTYAISGSYYLQLEPIQGFENRQISRVEGASKSKSLRLDTFIMHTLPDDHVHRSNETNLGPIPGQIRLTGILRDPLCPRCISRLQTFFSFRNKTIPWSVSNELVTSWSIWLPAIPRVRSMTSPTKRLTSSALVRSANRLADRKTSHRPLIPYMDDASLSTRR